MAKLKTPFAVEYLTAFSGTNEEVEVEVYEEEEEEVAKEEVCEEEEEREEDYYCSFETAHLRLLIRVH